MYQTEFKYANIAKKRSNIEITEKNIIMKLKGELKMNQRMLFFRII